jgi:hypothetical protein
MGERLAAARGLGDDGCNEALDLVLQAVEKRDLDDQLAMEVGRTIGRLAFELDRLVEVYNERAWSFSSTMYLAFDAETNLRSWMSQNPTPPQDDASS